VPESLVITHHDKLQLFEALKSAFRTFDDLERLAEFRLGVRLRDIVAETGMDKAVFALLREMESRSQLSELLLAALASRPTNAALVRLNQKLGVGSIGQALPRLEALLGQSCPPIDIAILLARLGEIETQVCRIEYMAQEMAAYGTGFLVGPDLVLTNAHVVERVRVGDVTPITVAVRFDYKALPDGPPISDGRVVRLAPHWLLDWSPADGFVPTAGSSTSQPLPYLDYAILRLSEPVGSQPLGRTPEPGASPRGWVRAYSGTPPASNNPIFIMQHPKGAPLKLAWGGRVLSVSTDGARMRHDVDTQPGSSGSPVFGCDLTLIAVHHAGDAASPPRYNQAVPIAKIVERLRARGLEVPLA
jgi:hypothetical protein